MADLTPEEITDLQKKAHAYDSDNGRLEKAQADFESERALRVATESKLVAAQSASVQLDPQDIELFGVDGTTRIDARLNGKLDPILEKLNTIGAKFEERDTRETAEQAHRTYKGELDKKLLDKLPPGFVSRMYDGGDLSSAWTEYVDSHPSVKRAQDEGDVASVSDTIGIFIHQNKELVTRGFSPREVGGSTGGIQSEYSDADYLRDVGVLDRQLANCGITQADHKTATDAAYAKYVEAQQKAEKLSAGYSLP